MLRGPPPVYRLIMESPSLALLERPHLVWLFPPSRATWSVGGHGLPPPAAGWRRCGEGRNLLWSDGDYCGRTGSGTRSFWSKIATVPSRISVRGRRLIHTPDGRLPTSEPPARFPRRGGKGSSPWSGPPLGPWS